PVPCSPIEADAVDGCGGGVATHHIPTPPRTLPPRWGGTRKAIGGRHERAAERDDHGTPSGWGTGHVAGAVIAASGARGGGDPAQGTPFWAYAKWWVRLSMQELVSELSGPVVLSDRALRQLARIKEARARARAESGCEASREELAARTGLTTQQVESLLVAER